MQKPEMLLRTAHYTEGVVVDPNGSIFFSMTEIGKISHLEPGAAAATVWSHVAAANGHKIDEAGAHIVMSSVGAVLRLDASGRTTSVLASKVDGRWLVYPNDVCLDRARGGFYVTDSGYKETPKTMPCNPQGRVYRVDARGLVREVAGGIAYSNGIELSPDGSRLYVGESVASRIWTYAVLDDGSHGERTQFANVPKLAETTAVPDGMTIGPDGRMYVAHYGAREVLVYEADGTLVERLAAGNRTTSHVAFAPDGRTLYISGGIEDESGPGAIFAVAL